VKVAYCSDLHLEFDSDLKLTNTDNADVLILAGDIIPIVMIEKEFNNTYAEEKPLTNFFDYITGQFKHIIYVLGNHEFYHGYVHSYGAKVKTLLKAYSNLHILTNDHIIIDDVLFIGGTMWTDNDKGDPLLEMNGSKLMNDFRIITDCDGKNYFKFKPLKARMLHYEFLMYLKSEFVGYKKKVVITHHSPSYETVDVLYKSSNYNGFYASNIDDYILGSDIDFWIYGHMHKGNSINIGNCNVLTNPRGYPYEIYDAIKPYKLKYFDILLD
jgi:Icc-related predicted phosphoesterase